MSFLTGITLAGLDPPAVQCTRNVPVPTEGGPFGMDTQITGERTFFPLGVNCTYDSPGDTFGPQTVVNSNWPATIYWIVSTGVALVGGVMVINPRFGTRPKISHTP